MTDPEKQTDCFQDMPTLAEVTEALSEVLPHHPLACVSRLNLHAKPWVFDMDDEGRPIITLESCRCDTGVKLLRRMLPSGHKKGFSPEKLAAAQSCQTQITQEHEQP